MKLIVCFLVFHCVICNETSNNKQKSGPYKTLLTRVERCKKTSYPQDPNPPILSHVETVNVNNSTYAKANFTILKDNLQMAFKIKNFIMMNGKWKLMSTINSMVYESLLLDLILKFLGVKYSSETCALEKGVYAYDKLDPNSMQHMWTSKMEYGRMIWRSEMLSSTATFTCWDFETTVVPL